MVLPDCVLLPGETLPLYIFEPRYRRMLEDVLEGSRSFCVARRRLDLPSEEPEEVACLGFVTVAVKQEDGTSHLQIQGSARVRLTEAMHDHPYPYFDLTLLESKPTPREACQKDLDRMHALLRGRLDSGIEAALETLNSSQECSQPLAKTRRQLEDGAAALVAEIENEADAGRAVDRTAATLLCDPDHRQEVLTEVDVAKRVRLLNTLLNWG